jgi:hypothetical protein
METKFYKKQNAKVCIKYFLPVMAFLMLVYSSCQKVETKVTPVTGSTTTTNQAISGQIALNLAKSLAGQTGGLNVHSDINSVSLGGHKYYNPSALCGFLSDSTINYTCTAGDTTTHTTGDAKFYFNCTNGKPAGYIACDSLVVVQTTPTTTFNLSTKQHYTIECLDANHLFNGVNGEIDFTNSLTTTDNSANSNVGTASYILSNLTIDTHSNDILSGTATFTASGTNNGQNWSLTGTVTYLGNYMADVTIDGKVYHVSIKPTCCQIANS